MRRRDFIKVIAGLAAAWPLSARAQTSAGKIYRLGILQPGKPPQPLVDILRDRLKDLGYREGHNIAYEYRWAEGKPDRLDELAKELVDFKVDVITTLSTPAAIAAKKVTKTIPIVFSAGRGSRRCGCGTQSLSPWWKRNRCLAAGDRVERKAPRNSQGDRPQRSSSGDVLERH